MRDFPFTMTPIPAIHRLLHTGPRAKLLRLCEPEIVSAEIDGGHQIVLQSIIVIVSWQVELVEAGVACWETRLTRISVKTS